MAERTTAAGDETDRPRWQWVGFGAGIIVTAWLPLAFGALALASRLAVPPESSQGAAATAGLGSAALHVGALALASFAGGVVVGRWGPSSVGVREAALAGLVASVASIAAGCPVSAFAPGYLLLATLRR